MNTIVKRAAASLGLDPKLYGGHSLRRGFVTSSARAGIDVAAIMGVTGHANVKQVMGYIETATPFKRDVGSSLLSALDDQPEEEMTDEPKPKTPLREYVPPKKDGGLKATIGEINGPLLTKLPPPQVIEHNGQPLVDRKAAQEFKRRVVKKPDFTKDGAACDVAWLTRQALRLEEKGRSAKAIAAAFTALKIRRGDGNLIDDKDVERWLA